MAELTDNDITLWQLQKFVDHIYLTISRQLDALTKSDRWVSHEIYELQKANKEKEFEFQQYKKKIQRIEQFLIEHGLIKLLKEHENGNTKL